MYTSGACQMVLSSAWKPKGVSVLLYAPLLAMPHTNSSGACACTHHFNFTSHTTTFTARFHFQKVFCSIILLSCSARMGASDA